MQRNLMSLQRCKAASTAVSRLGAMNPMARTQALDFSSSYFAAGSQQLRMVSESTDFSKSYQWTSTRAMVYTLTSF